MSDLKTAWLIEKPNGITRAITYWTGSGFSIDANEAIKFHSERDSAKGLDFVPFAERRGCRLAWYVEVKQ